MRPKITGLGVTVLAFWGGVACKCVDGICRSFSKWEQSFREEIKDSGHCRLRIPNGLLKPPFGRLQRVNAQGDCIRKGRVGNLNSGSIDLIECVLPFDDLLQEVEVRHISRNRQRPSSLWNAIQHIVDSCIGSCYGLICKTFLIPTLIPPSVGRLAYSDEDGSQEGKPRDHDCIPKEGLEVGRDPRGNNRADGYRGDKNRPISPVGVPLTTVVRHESPGDWFLLSWNVTESVGELP
ncbi:Uncharacterised protein [Achromobacter aegrifaciens]|uniref:Uncharacterized protein n=1 Tax=Achromobacter aegrifaciens TaxID=1287736 RepID=A0AAD2KJY6_ACHAE|nr:Uncharacterised protein [Achromobacter aegrifaciens]